MNKYYTGAVFCPKCRKMVKESEFIYECVNALGGDDAHKNNFYRQTGTNSTEIATSDGGFHYYFRRPHLRLFKSNSKFAVCSVCKNKSTNIACPECYSYLSSSAHRTEVISVVGIKGCGKSVYLSALVDSIKTYLNFKKLSVTHVHESVENYILRPGQKLPGGTPSGQIDPIQLHIGRKDKDDKYPLDLLIYDVAGEDLKKKGAAATELFRHLAMSSLIIYLFDSLTDQYHANSGEWSGRNEIKEHSKRCMEGISSTLTNESIIMEINEQVRLRHRLDLNRRDNRSLPIYLAGCISSTDFLRWKPGLRPGESYSPDTDISNEYYKCYRAIDLIDGTIHESEFKKMQNESSQAVRSRLFKWKENSTIAQFEDNFKEVAYFGVSALGQSPDVSGDDFICPEAYSPRNVVNPVAWFFDEAGILESLKK